MLNIPKYNSVQEICAAIEAIPPEKRVYFFDMDGTLLDINHEAPDDIMLDKAALKHLRILNEITNGGVVINTGRKEWFLNKTLRDFKPRAALEHGVFRRDEENGAIVSSASFVDMELLRKCSDISMKSIRPYDLELEFKSQGIAYHWRHSNQPSDTMDMVAGYVVRSIVNKYNEEAKGKYKPIKFVGGKMVYEIGPDSADKADAVVYFMENYYKGRTPIYFGDEAADQRAMKDKTIDHYRGIGIATTGVITGPTFRVESPSVNREIIAKNVYQYRQQAAFSPALMAC